MSVAQTFVHSGYFQVSQWENLWKQPTVTLKPDAQILANTKLKFKVFIFIVILLTSVDNIFKAWKQKQNLHYKRGPSVHICTQICPLIRSLEIDFNTKCEQGIHLRLKTYFSHVLLCIYYTIFQVHGRCKKNNISGSKHYLTVASGVMTSVFVSPVLAAVTVGEIIF